MVSQRTRFLSFSSLFINPQATNPVIWVKSVTLVSDIITLVSSGLIFKAKRTGGREASILPITSHCLLLTWMSSIMALRVARRSDLYLSECIWGENLIKDLIKRHLHYLPLPCWPAGPGSHICGAEEWSLCAREIVARAIKRAPMKLLSA